MFSIFTLSEQFLKKWIDKLFKPDTFENPFGMAFVLVLLDMRP